MTEIEQFLTECFYEALKASRRTIGDLAEVYAVHLLRDHVYNCNALYDLPLALIMVGLQDATIHQRALTYQNMGDISIIQAGLHYRACTTVPASYFHQMGTMGYKNASSLQASFGTSPNLAAALGAMSEHFESVAEVFRVLGRRFFPDNENLLLETEYAASGSESSLLLLAERDIFVVQDFSGEMQ